MWRALMDWLPDLKVGTIEIRDVVSLVVALLGGVLAFMAIRLNRRQAHIAETQHRIILLQHGENPSLELHSLRTPDDEKGVLRLAIWNDGIAPVKLAIWVIWFPDDGSELTFVLPNGRRLKSTFPADPRRRDQIKQVIIPAKEYLDIGVAHVQKGPRPEITSLVIKWSALTSQKLLSEPAPLFVPWNEMLGIKDPKDTTVSTNTDTNRFIY